MHDPYVRASFQMGVGGEEGVISALVHAQGGARQRKQAYPHLATKRCFINGALHDQRHKCTLCLFDLRLAGRFCTVQATLHCLPVRHKLVTPALQLIAAALHSVTPGLKLVTCFPQLLTLPGKQRLTGLQRIMVSLQGFRLLPLLLLVGHQTVTLLMQPLTSGLQLYQPLLQQLLMSLQSVSFNLQFKGALALLLARCRYAITPVLQMVTLPLQIASLLTQQLLLHLQLPTRSLGLDQLLLHMLQLLYKLGTGLVGHV